MLKKQYNVVEGEIVAKNYSTAHIANNMFNLRKKLLSVSQEKFSEMTDLSKDTISNIQRGRYCPNLETLVSISNQTDTPIEYFLLKKEG